MKLSFLTKDLPIKGRHGADADVEISKLAYDTRQVTAGALFCTWRGFKTDGHRLVADAVARGAAALMVEKVPESPPNIPVLVVESGRRALALAAANFYGQPARTLDLTGITGTNGKSSVGFLLHYLKEQAGQKCGLLGTVEYRAGAEKIVSSRTTPESSDLQALLARIRDAGCQSAVMEVSSHALELDRVYGVPFRAAVFTNLTRDHLDFHETLENYFVAKLKLFSSLPAGALAVVNLDDARAARVLEAVPLTARAVTFGFSPSAAYRAENVQLSATGSVFDFVTPNGALLVRSPWIGKYNVANTLAALTVMAANGEATLEELANWLPFAPFVSGRLQKVTHGGGFTVLVDYAHSDDAVRNVLQSLRPLCRGKLKILLGCGGDRDRTKRPLMALAACELADEAIFTADNPRAENLEIILRDMKVGVLNFTNYRVVPDRAAAIVEILRDAADGDLIVLAGKGHETTQEINGMFQHFSDVEAAEEVLKRSTGNPACVNNEAPAILPVSDKNTDKIVCATLGGAA
ncbi:MAG: UDP-N-acetylmuramoyl-L-alanyl-D-glutamate--2,6-diaminopimelate ligase [Verrucomicrobiales bacterium]|jgi:UDP-N-acetylmuramoyl-L-alanyl-D-glutamate--2,6-diaminopimelate ligase|nr:UDP-N-acetylmuramoyl-L-alanyl-D-glutamate--2,6-diaminopimelate ligase [Verrucomicrobiales bacterium]